MDAELTTQRQEKMFVGRGRLTPEQQRQAEEQARQLRAELARLGPGPYHRWVKYALLVGAIVYLFISYIMAGRAPLVETAGAAAASSAWLKLGIGRSH